MSERPLILVTRTLMPDAEARLLRSFKARLSADDVPLSTQEIIAAAEGVDGILISPTDRLDADAVTALPPGVRIIACHSVGVDNVNIEAARRRGIVVTNTPDVLSAATTEIALLLMLGAARRASEGERLIRGGNWKYWAINFMVGTEMTGKRLGIIGMGRIGQLVAKRARGFDMTIHYWNRRRLPPELEGGAQFHERIEELLPQADFLSIHCPLTDETRGLLNAERLALLPRGAIVVNTARGPIIDDEALIAALRSGQVAAAGLDVFTDEPRINPAYLTLDNTFLLPHVGSATRETRTAMGIKAIANLEAFFQGDAPPDRVV
ncbi:MAG: D-glycerate dehydrogenase [Sphingomonadales bacterium]|nr:D-glycerate dehydrogenase [Sphingomonadales bacterium]